MAIDQLRQVFVTGGNDAARAALCSLLCQRANYIVGLNTINHEYVPAVGGNSLMQRLDLRAQVIRHGRAIGFIVGIPVVAESFAFGVEYTGAIIRRVIFLQTPQHVEHALYSAGGQAARAAQIGHRMKCAIQVR